MKKEFISRYFRRLCMRILILGMLCAAVCRIAETHTAVGEWIATALHTSVDITAFWK